ncbi:MAG: hypothetical protein SP1CHLAM54_07390 [Chlamydiia bacterium]|nr:hypothetical protein [Chlamydiia bacterium]MCH9615645.1 hypothetical protein [Chlamydiia bacterium]MCH9628952.1 hypothetical protein [Chlamydiia bacterium]
MAVCGGANDENTLGKDLKKPTWLPPWAGAAGELQQESAEAPTPTPKIVTRIAPKDVTLESAIPAKTRATAPTTFTAPEAQASVAGAFGAGGGAGGLTPGGNTVAILMLPCSNGYVVFNNV